ncbi:MAG: helix-turn-helix domain-containing protein [SAR324 cluster bacterium]|nr:helix-turn-helix domain-containing protein [SAR324 cluster bacterium]
MREEHLPIIFGLKLRRLRVGQGYGLAELSERSGLSLSYLNEIEKGKKYPKADKILQLAKALDTDYDELVSLKLGHPYGAIETLLDSPMVQALPLSLFGLAPRDIVNLIARSPREVGAFLHTLAELASSYDVHVEHFFYAMLRSYQQTHENHFEDIESAAAGFRKQNGWKEQALRTPSLAAVLTSRFGVTIDEETLVRQPELSGFRSVWIKGPPERLLLNRNLTSAQKAFQIGREIGYRELGLTVRGAASSRAEAESFEQVLNDFKASYYAGALLIDQRRLVGDLKAFFRNPHWDAAGFLKMMNAYRVTPEMFLYRLTQLAAVKLGLKHYHFIRVGYDTVRDTFEITKQFNMAGLLIPAGVGLHEHYCRRSLAVSLLNDLRERAKGRRPQAPIAAAQRALFLHTGEQYFLITLARPLALNPEILTSVTLAFLVDGAFRRAVRFWSDPDVPQEEVNRTCERCSLSISECSLRAAPPALHLQHELQQSRTQALQRLLQSES